ncbi:MAG TPA: FISUMP domain-containing protein [Saprospiraceae bacterium]|nr:FISUMP domain-containing protein [Saprospiraceae bacterium]
MKRLVLFLTFFSIVALINAQRVGINTATPNTSAVLDVESTTRGFLPPRMTTSQRNAIVSPAIGLVIYNSTTNCLNYYIGYVWIESCGTGPRYPSGFIPCSPSNPTLIVEVTNSTTGRTWMDRNLGATQVATSSLDENAYGDLYQWGRFADGHQCRTSLVHSSGLANTAVPNAGNTWDGKFIISGGSPFDWLSPQNINLWQAITGTNDPCPSGYRLPTEAEWEAERLSWSSNDEAGAFASPLKLTRAGYRIRINGLVDSDGSFGLYWSSTRNGTASRHLFFDISDALMITEHRAYGFCVRCIKN